jgi:hypothetical protein
VTAQNATIDPKNGMYRRRSGLVGAKYGSKPANGNVDFLTAMARCPRDDASFILSHLGRVTADAGAAARGDLGDDGALEAALEGLRTVRISDRFPRCEER